MIRPGIEQHGAWFLEVAQHQLVNEDTWKYNHTTISDLEIT